MSGEESDVDPASVRLSRTRTWGGLDTESSYGPADAKPDYDRDLGDPGVFPFTRGSYPQMYRSRMWTLRNIVGYGAPDDTRAGLAAARASGTAGTSIVLDALTQEALDPDHPALGADVGMEGCSVGCVRDMERLLRGIDLTTTDVAWHSTMMIYPLVVATATKQGVDLARLQGSHMPDHLQLRLAGWGESLVPAALGHRTAVDTVEFAVRTTPRWSLGLPQAYDLRECGLGPSDEIAVGMAIACQTIEDLQTRGVPVDEVAPSLAWVSGTDMDLFEEVAKFRALRRIWARTMRDRFHAQDKRSMRLRIACHTSGRALVYPQPLNNLTRAAVQTLAALLGGVQSVETCTYDEPISIPSHEARELATRTQQILAHEVGAARTADPLGGSWYVESLTDQVEKAALERLAAIEEIGLVKAVTDGMIESLMAEHNDTVQRELDDGERVVVGVNRFVPPAAESPKRFTFDRSGVEAHLRRFAEMKSARDPALLSQNLAAVLATCRRGENPTQVMVDALVADATVGEVWGTVRVAHGHPYDPFGVVSPPVDLS